MFCPKCGYENDSDARYCEKCGASLIKDGGLLKNKKFFILGGLVLLAFLGVSAGFILPGYLNHGNNSSNSTLSNQTTVASNHENVTGKNSTVNKARVIDSGSTSGYDDYYWNSDFNYEWKAYEYDKNHIEIKGTISILNPPSTIEQSTILRKDPTATNPELVIIDVSPKMSGKSGYETYTTMQGYSTVEDYYMNYFRSNLMENGPFR